MQARLWWLRPKGWDAGWARLLGPVKATSALQEESQVPKEGPMSAHSRTLQVGG